MTAQVAHPESIVETDWVAEHAGDDNVVLVEVDVDTAAYEQGHIPGAIGWNWTTQLNDTVTRDILEQRADRVPARFVRRHAGYDDRRLRRQQQLVRDLRLLAAQDLRSLRRARHERRTHQVGDRGTRPDDRRAMRRGDLLHRERCRPRHPRHARRHAQHR